MMSEIGESFKGAVTFESEAAENIDAAVTERERGSAVSFDLLLDAIRKERTGLNKLEEGIELMRQSVDDRRKSLDQQEELLMQLINDCNT